MKLTGRWKRDTYGWSYRSRNGRRDYGHTTYFSTERAAKRWVIGALREHILALQEVFV